jgi:hypothetical protein
MNLNKWQNSLKLNEKKKENKKSREKKELGTIIGVYYKNHFINTLTHEKIIITYSGYLIIF